jgi:putative membrane protein
MLLNRIAVSAVAVGGLLLLSGTAAFAAPSGPDSTYLKAAHQSNLAEIAGGGLAQSKADSQQVKDLGARFVTDHTKLDKVLRQTASSLGVSLPSAPNAQQQALAARYKAASGRQFDSLFISTQMDAHMAAMRLGQTEIANGTDASAKKAAQDAAPVIASHHDLLSAAARDLGVPDSINTGTGGLAARSGLNGAGVSLLSLGVLLVAGAILVLRRRRVTAE